MKTSLRPGLFLCGALVCSAQTAALPDPTLDSASLPACLRLLPQPAAEPWRRITGKERLENYAYRAFSAYAGLAAVAGGAISQAVDSPDEWRQGWGPYGIRVASSYGSTFVANTITYGASAMVRDDNRYFRSRKNGFKARLTYALISPYVARNNAGQLRFSTSSFMGGVGGAAIPLMWSPASWQGWNNVAVNYGLWYSGLAGGNLVRECYPSLVRFYKNRRRNQAPPAVAHPR